MSRVAISADLAHVNLGSLLQLSEAEFFSGRLLVPSVGHIELASGCAVDAAAADGLSGVPAIRELFLTREGPASIELDDAVKGEPLAPTISLVMDGCRVLDEWCELAAGAWAYRGLATSPSEAVVAAEGALSGVLSALGKTASLEVAVQAAALPRSVALPHLRVLVEAGTLTPTRPDHTPSPSSVVPPTQPADSPDITSLVDRGRAAFRQGDLEAAESFWSQALAARPNDRVLAQNLRLVRQRLSS